MSMMQLQLTHQLQRQRCYLDTAVNICGSTTGSGKDDVSMDHGATVAFKGSISMGAGNDKLTITSLNGAADLVDNSVTLDGGDGTDTIVMNTALTAAISALIWLQTMPKKA